MSVRNLTAAAIAALSLVSFAAAAADVRVSCEKRTNRSRISVDGSNLAAGSYSAVVASGDKTAMSNFRAAVGDEAQFDFDSNSNDIAQGATAVSGNFIVDGRVRAAIQNSSGQIVTPIVDAICRVRN